MTTTTKAKFDLKASMEFVRDEMRGLSADYVAKCTAILDAVPAKAGVRAFTKAVRETGLVSHPELVAMYR